MNEVLTKYTLFFRKLTAIEIYFCWCCIWTVVVVFSPNEKLFWQISQVRWCHR